MNLHEDSVSVAGIGAFEKGGRPGGAPDATFENGDLLDPAPGPREEMQRRAEELLEFPKVREMLAGKTHFSLARERATDVRPVWTREEVSELQEETAEGRLLLDTQGDIGLGGLDDPRPLLHRASLGGTLSGEELLTVANALDAVYETGRVARSLKSEAPRLTRLGERISDLRGVSHKIRDSLTESGAVRDSATPRLAELRGRVATTYNRVVRSIEHVMGSSDVAPALQSRAIAARGDRLVLEVKVEQRKAVPGIVHDVSNTGATLFVEPFSTVELCNEWRETTAEVGREEQKVLRRLSESIADAFDDAIYSFEAAAELDLIMARARLGQSMHAARPDTLDQPGETSLHLIDARHPLLGEKAVPATISIGPEFRALVITGPNAGGKTVALKAAGLLALMHQAGLQIPASGDSRLAVFDGVFADIGDSQSIERSVSTFTSHMGAVVDIQRWATERSLVLIDELGTGTDPEEGAALARAILGDFADRRIPTIVTTHHRDLAEFAGQRADIENASMELDPDTMMPNYHLVMGLPGRSYAIAVARHLGMSSNVIRGAEESIGSSRLEADELLKQLQVERRKLAELASEAERDRASAEDLRRSLEVELSEIRRRQDDIVEETRRELRREAEELRKSLRRIEREARDKEHHAAARRAAERTRRKLQDPNWLSASRPKVGGKRAAEVSGDANQERFVVSAADEKLAPGDTVELKGLGTRAEVKSVRDDGELELLIGGATARLQLSEVRRLEGVKVPKAAAPKVQVKPASSEPFTSELDLRGRRAHEVRDAVADFLDDATLQGASTVRIIHGRGTGALREAVRETLAEHVSANAFYPGKPQEGGDGVTVVEVA